MRRPGWVAAATSGTHTCDVAHELAEKLGSDNLERRVLVCGTGMGVGIRMAMIANKQPRVYAAVCEDAATAAKARSINNAHILTLGGLYELGDACTY